MLNSRQRAQLRGLANGLDTIFQVGKGGLNDQLYKQVSEALEARELIKLRVLETSPVSSREAADEIARKQRTQINCFGEIIWVLLPYLAEPSILFI